MHVKLDDELMTETQRRTSGAAVEGRTWQDIIHERLTSKHVVMVVVVVSREQE